MAYIQEYKNQATHILQICNQISSSKKILMKMKHQLITLKFIKDSFRTQVKKEKWTREDTHYPTTNLKKTKASTRVGASWPCREKEKTQRSHI